MTVASPGPEFPIQDIPFSYRGSWFNLSPVVAEKTYADDVHLVSHQTGLHPVLRLTPAVAGTTVVATPALLTWRSGADRIEAVYDGPAALRIRGRRLGLRIAAAADTLTPFSGTYLYLDPTDGSHVFTSYETGRRYRITVLSGALRLTAGVEALGTADRFLDLGGEQQWEIAIEEYATARRPYTPSATFDELCRRRSSEFAAFVDAVAPWRGADTPAAELAAYVLWSATVSPAGFLARPAVLMSKHWMDKVWSWDHCFNAIALAAGEPELAWHQFHLPFDHQDAAGALPDSVAHSEVLHNYVKPPIHGWALQQLRRRLPQPPDRVALAVERVRADLATTPFLAPEAARLAELGLGRREIAAAVRAGALVRLTDTIVLLPGAIEQAVGLLAGLPQPFTLSQARRTLGTTRRVAVPLLELLDRRGATRRLPDDRRILALASLGRASGL